MKNILIIGANSSITRDCIKIWSKQNNKFFFVARDIDELNKFMSQIEYNHIDFNNKYIIDLNNIEDHIEIFNRAKAYLKKIDIVFICYGTLPNQSECEKNFHLLSKEINTNATSKISIINLAIKNLDENSTIAVVTSVAGDRGRSSNYIYGACQSMVNEYISGIRQKLHGSKIRLLTIKPGLIDTKMTNHFKKNFLWTKSDVAAKKITEAVNSQKDEVYIPFYWYFIMKVIKIIPTKIFKRLKF